jgi:ABC-type phosphate transport system substrate-binding protein
MELWEEGMMKKVIAGFLLLCFLLSGRIAKAQDVVVVANSSVKTSDVSGDEIKSVFSGEKSSLKDGSHVAPVTLKGGTVHEAFLKKYVGKDDGAFRASWRSLVFTGQGSMPKTFENEAELVAYVGETPGAIGYVSKETPHEKVKTLAVK